MFSGIPGAISAIVSLFLRTLRVMLQTGSNYAVISSLKVTIPETNSSPLKMVISNRNLLFQWSIFRDYVSFRKCISLCLWGCQNPGSKDFL